MTLHLPTAARTIRPIAASSIYGMVFHEGMIWAIDLLKGFSGFINVEVEIATQCYYVNVLSFCSIGEAFCTSYVKLPMPNFNRTLCWCVV
ncbi:MAG: hypothetical protein AAFR62_09805 [Cyanobacteria bacterium J06629_2]